MFLLAMPKVVGCPGQRCFSNCDLGGLGLWSGLLSPAFNSGCGLGAPRGLLGAGRSRVGEVLRLQRGSLKIGRKSRPKGGSVL